MDNQKKRLRLGEILIEQGVITQEALERALKKQKENGGLLGAVMLNMGLVTEDDMTTTYTNFGEHFSPNIVQPVQVSDAAREISGS